MRLASELGMTTYEAQATHTSSDLVDWMVELDDRANQFNPLFWYLAAIACEVRRGYVKHPGRVKVKQFLMKFESKEKPKKMTDEEVAEMTERAKAATFARFGLDKNGDPIKRK